MASEVWESLLASLHDLNLPSSHQRVAVLLLRRREAGASEDTPRTWTRSFRVTLLTFCPRCLALARFNYDATPDPVCGPCAGSGYVKASYEERRRYWAFCASQAPRA